MTDLFVSKATDSVVGGGGMCVDLNLVHLCFTTELHPSLAPYTEVQDVGSLKPEMKGLETWIIY